MKLSFVRVLCVGIILLCADNFAFGQDGRYRRLTVDDFRGVPQSLGGAIAHTKCTIDFRYQPVDNYYHLTFNVKLVLQRNQSWIDKRRITSTKMLDQVLKHEQGHYNIAFIEQQEILREAARMRFSSNYRAETMALFNRIDNKYQQLNASYDEDTQHMLDATQQHSWDVYFQRKLAYMPPVAKEGY